MFQGYRCELSLPTLHGGSLTITVPLIIFSHSEGRLTGYKAPELTERLDTETSWVRSEDGVQAAKFSIPLSDYINDVSHFWAT